MRGLLTRFVGVGLLVVVALSWFAPGSVDSLFAINLGETREVARPLHEGTEWAKYLAPEGTCRGDGEIEGAAREQIFAMRCLLDWARRERGLPPLRMEHRLNRSSALKAAAIVRCNEFSHTPCGTAFSGTFTAVGWQRGSGENIAWGASVARSPRLLVDGWLHSDGHRKNLFRTDWRVQGLALLPADSFQGERQASIWVHQFGA